MRSGGVRLSLRKASVQLSFNRIEVRDDGVNGDWPLLQRVPLVPCLLPHFSDGIPRHKALPEFVIHQRWGRPGVHDALRRELPQDTGIQGIRFGATWRSCGCVLDSRPPPGT